MAPVRARPNKYDMWKKQQQANLQAEELSPVVGHQCPKMAMPACQDPESGDFCSRQPRPDARYTLPAGSKPKLLEPVQMIEGDNVRPNGQPGQRFLPIVYCSYETTFMEFSAFLTSMGLEHYVFHGKDSEKRRSEMKHLVAESIYLIGEGPFCALLHPSIIEGLSLTWNPCMVVLDNIRGYGIQEQVYGRVLRNLQFADSFVRPSGADERWRLRKYIYQLRSYYPQEQTWTEWWKGQKGSQANYTKSVLRGDKPLSEADVLTMSTVRPGDDLRGYVSDKARRDICTPPEKSARPRTCAELARRSIRAPCGPASRRSPPSWWMRGASSARPDQLVMAESGKQAGLHRRGIQR